MSNVEQPYYQAHVFVCTNERPVGHRRGSCAHHDAAGLRDYMKAKAKALRLPETRINNAGCLDRCELGPVMVIYPEGIWYRYDNEADIDEILETHLVNGRHVTRLMLDADQRPPKG